MVCLSIKEGFVLLVFRNGCCKTFSVMSRKNSRRCLVRCERKILSFKKQKLYARHIAS